MFDSENECNNPIFSLSKKFDSDNEYIKSVLVNQEEKVTLWYSSRMEPEDVGCSQVMLLFRQSSSVEEVRHL